METSIVTRCSSTYHLQVVNVSRLFNAHTFMTAEMAINVGLLTGTSPESRLFNQEKWDLWQASLKPFPKGE